MSKNDKKRLFLCFLVFLEVSEWCRNEHVWWCLYCNQKEPGEPLTVASDRAMTMQCSTWWWGGYPGNGWVGTRRGGTGPPWHTSGFTTDTTVPQPVPPLYHSQYHSSTTTDRHRVPQCPTPGTTVSDTENTKIMKFSEILCKSWNSRKLSENHEISLKIMKYHH